MKQLDVDADVASILVQEGFSTIEEIAYVPASELNGIEEFDEEIVKELRTRARDVLLTQAIASEESVAGAEPSAELVEIAGEELAKTLSGKGVRTRDDLADLAVDELIEAGGVDEKRAAELIMEARKHWFAEAAKA
jgi:N utilization substance protein A